MPHSLLLVVLGALLAGYLALDGATFGVGMLRPWLGRDDGERRLLLNVVGPFFLGNEVWIVATAGLLFGAFPTLEGSLLTAFYPLVVLVVGAMLARDAGMWFRSRRDSARWRSTWDAVFALASLALAMGWGMVLGNLAQAVPAGHIAPRGVALFDPYALLCGVTFVLLAACHGAVFVMMRSRGPVNARAGSAVTRLVAPAAAAVVATVGIGVPVAGGVDRPVVAAVVALAALIPLVAARWLAHTARRGTAFACTAASIALPVIGVGVGVAPTVTAMAAASSTLAVLGMFLLAVLPAMAVGQVWLWHAFHGPVGPTSPMYF